MLKVRRRGGGAFTGWPTPYLAAPLPLPMSRLDALLAFYRDDPDDPFTRFALAQEYLKADDPEQALGFFEGLVRDHPDYVGTYYHLGLLYERLGRDEAAAATYRAGVTAATRAGDLHARAELQGALLAAEGLGFDD